MLTNPNLRRHTVEHKGEEIVFREELGIDNFTSGSLYRRILEHLSLEELNENEQSALLYFVAMVTQREKGGENIFPSSTASGDELIASFENFWMSPQYATLAQRCINAIDALSLVGDPETDPKDEPPPDEK